MEVVCGRCRASYEFDDALLSAGGTTVRCTRCGSEFAIYPEEGRSDEWSVWVDGAPEPSRYESFAELERDITLGKIGPEDLLARGADLARPLSSISELGPLLREHASLRPPGRDPPGQHRFAKTRLGLPSLENRVPPELLTGDRASPPPLERPRRPHDGKKVRSALSGPFLGVRVAPDPGPGTLPSGTPPALSSRGRPPLLSETLPSVSPPREVEAALGSRPGAKVPSSRPGSVPPSSPRFAKDLALATAVDGTRQVPDVLRETPTRPRRSTAIEPVSPPSSLSSGVRSAPGSAPRRRGARAVLIVAAVLGGALAFGLTVGRKSLQRTFALSVPAALPDTTLTVPSPDSEAPTASIHREVRALDWLWLRSLLLENSSPARGPLMSELRAQVQRMQSELERIPESPERLWDEVDLLRINGQIDQARLRMRELGARAMERPYSLALLDLADPGAGPPSRSLLAELARARMVDDSELLARVALVYAFVQAGSVERAETLYEELKAEPERLEQPLLSELGAFVLRAKRQAVDAPAGPTADEEVLDEAPKEEPPPASASQAPDAPVEKRKTTVPTPAVEKPAAAPPRTASRDAIPAEVGDWVARADALWSGGDQAGAVRLYQQVLSAVGNTHFLGQRASARIAQAAREKASSQ